MEKKKDQEEDFFLNRVTEPSQLILYSTSNTTPEPSTESHHSLSLLKIQKLIDIDKSCPKDSAPSQNLYISFGIETNQEAIVGDQDVGVLVKEQDIGVSIVEMKDNSQAKNDHAKKDDTDNNNAVNNNTNINDAKIMTS